MIKKILAFTLIFVSVFTFNLSAYASDNRSVDNNYIISETEFQLIKSAIDSKLDELDGEEIPDVEIVNILRDLGLEHVQWRRPVNSYIQPRANTAGADFVDLSSDAQFARATLIFSYAWSLFPDFEDPVTLTYSGIVRAWCSTGGPEFLTVSSVLVSTGIHWVQAAINNGTVRYSVPFASPHYNGTYVKFECDLVVSGFNAGTARRTLWLR